MIDNYEFFCFTLFSSLENNAIRLSKTEKLMIGAKLGLHLKAATQTLQWDELGLIIFIHPT